jgi:hypothetical protein
LKILKALALSAVIFAASASAATIIQTVTIPSASTDVTDAPALLNFFASSGAPAGSTLTGVTFEFVISESLNALSLSNASSSTETAKYVASANFDAGDTANATDAANLDHALANNSGDPAITIFNTGTLSFAGTQTDNTFALPAVLTEDTGVITTASLSSYTGTGTFVLDYSTLSSFTVTGGGNNISSSQSTTTSAVATVIYTYSPPSVPEPATLALSGSGLLALALMGRKKLFR